MPTLVEPRIVIAVKNASFDKDRQRSLVRLLGRLEETAPGCKVVVAKDVKRQGATWCFLEAAKLALACRFERTNGSAEEAMAALDGGERLADAVEHIEGATHVVILPDDVMTCLSFETALRGIIDALPDDVVDFYLNTNHPATEVAGGRFYTQDMAAAGFLIFPRALLVEHLAWREDYLHEHLATDDLGVNLWALLTGRKIYKPVMSLVDHDTSLPSLVPATEGSANPGQSRYAKPRHVVMDGKFFGPGKWAPKSDAPHLGRQSVGSHWQSLYAVASSGWNLEATFTAERHGRPVSAEPRIMIATPVYDTLHPMMAESRAKLIAGFGALGIKADYLELKGHSDLFRARQFLMTQFLCSDANVLLQWDADLEVVNVYEAMEMLLLVAKRPFARGVVGGSYPFRDGSRGRVVATPTNGEARAHDFFADGTVQVKEIGTGFLACSRAAILRLCEEHPELLYSSQSPNPALFGQPLWALFDSMLVSDPDVLGGRRRLTEDYAFCRRAWDSALGVVAYAPVRIRHWAGETPHDGNIATWKEAIERGSTEPPAEAAAEPEPMAFDTGADHAGATVQRGSPS